MGATYLLEHIAGCFLFDEHLALVESGPPEGKEKEAFLKRHASAIPFQYPAHAPQLRRALVAAASKIRKEDLRAANLTRTRHDVKHAVSDDFLIVQAVKSIEDLDKILNSLAIRLRDWYEFYLPEYSASQPDHAEFVRGVVEITKEQFLSGKKTGSFGADLGKPHIAAMKRFAERLLGLYAAKQELEGYVDGTMETLCPNLRAVAGSTLGAKLLEHAGTLKRLAELPSSTVQILGAEKALFRHLKTGSRPPKYGVLLAHDAVQSAPKGRQGRAARILADKISIAVRIDYFKGQFKGDALLEEARKKIAQ